MEDTVPRFGPGDKYEAYDKLLPAGKEGQVSYEEGDWVQFEYKSANGKQHRVWVPTEVVNVIEYAEDETAKD